MIKYSVYEGEYNWSHPTRSISSEELYELITSKESDVYKQSKIVRDNYHLKVSGNKDDYRKYQTLKRSQLISVVPGLVENVSRSVKELGRKYVTDDITGYFTLDVDNISEEQDKLKNWFRHEKFREIPYLHFVARSISGLMDGSLFVIVHISDELFKYVIDSETDIKKLICSKFKNDTGLTAKMANGVTQSRYISYDKNAYLNQDTIPITKKELSIYISDTPKNKKRNKKASQVDCSYSIDRYNKHIALEWTYKQALMKEQQCRGNNFEFLKKWIPLSYGAGLSVEDVYNYAHKLDFSDKDELLDIIEHYYDYLDKGGCNQKLVPATDNLELLEYKPNKNKVYDRILKPNEYISLPTDLLNFQKIIIEAPAGGGKTTAIIQHFENSDDGCIFLQPYRIVAEQKAKICGWNLIVEGRVPNRDKNQVGTYNAISKILRSNEVDMKNSFLVIDEAHLMVTDNFRADVMDNLYNAFDFFKGVILITATHIDATIFKDFKLIKYNTPDVYKKFDLIQATDIAPAMLDAVDRGSLNFVFLDHKDNQSLYSEVLVKQGYRVEMMNKDQKDSRLYKAIVNNGVIPNDVDVVLTTRFLSHGIDLFAPERRVNFVICPGLKLRVQSSYQIIQFINRFRSKYDIKIKIILKKDLYYMGESINIASLKNSIKSNLELSCKNVNNKIATLDYGESYTKEIKQIISRDSLIPDIDSDCYTFSNLSFSQKEYQEISRYEDRNIIFLLDYLHEHNLLLQNIVTFDGKFNESDQLTISQSKENNRVQKKNNYQNEIVNAFAILRREKESENEAYYRHVKDEAYYRHVKDRKGGLRLLELNEILKNLRISRNILYYEGINAYNLVVRRAKILKDSYGSQELINRIRSSFKIGKIYSVEERELILDEIIKESESNITKDFEKDYLSKNKPCVNLFFDIFEISRVNRRGINNGYKIISHNPFAKYYKMFSSGIYSEGQSVYDLRQVS